MKGQKGQETDIAILIMGYNRPNDMRKLIDALRPIKPTRIYFSVDGARILKKGDEEKVLETQGLLNEINWDCSIKTRFLTANTGCKIAISSAIDWLFENEDCGIILEDDCIPTNEFISFATRMLTKYENDERIMHISANSFFPEIPHYEFNHYFSKLPGVWGWATWKRAWNKLEFNSEIDSELDAQGLITDFYGNRAISNWFFRYYRESLSPKASAWSPHWIFAIIQNNGLAVTPMANLVRNIGFTSDSTHATSKSFQAYNDFTFGGLPELPDPSIIVEEDYFDKLRFRVIRKTDPNLFIMRRIKIFFLTKIYLVSPYGMKRRVKKITSKSRKLTKFLEE